SVDLEGIKFSDAAASLSVTPTGSTGGTWTIGDGTNAMSFAMMGGDFPGLDLADDGHGGTLVTADPRVRIHVDIQPLTAAQPSEGLPFGVNSDVKEYVSDSTWDPVGFDPLSPWQLPLPLLVLGQAAALNFTASGIAGATVTGDSVVSSGATLTQPL